MQHDFGNAGAIRDCPALVGAIRQKGRQIDTDEIGIKKRIPRKHANREANAVAEAAARVRNNALGPIFHHLTALVGR